VSDVRKPVLFYVRNQGEKLTVRGLLRNLYACFIILAVLAFPLGVKAWNRALGADYGRVVISKYSLRADIAPVVFDHWVHRSKFTCRLCHVDIGFAMKANGTDITAATNNAGLYCGSCHNGRRYFRGRIIFAACSENVTAKASGRCEQCHSLGKKKAGIENDFDIFARKMPKAALGNKINWEEAEAKGFIKPIDFLEGVSIKRDPLKAREDFSVEAKATWVGDVIFSHKKHAVWNGCEVCHPEIFPSVEKGALKYTMFEIADGQYCGVCHDKVAFPLSECDRCHSKPVKMAP